VQIDSWLSEDDERSLANDVLDGLTKPFKELSPKYLYDARGSELFEQITELPEYYPTRTETAILRERAAEIVALTGAGDLVELGAGASDKARILLDAMPRLVALLGGTIGNFPPGTRRTVLGKTGGLLGPRDRLLLGTDLVKDPRVIEAAYNDSAGITGEFNRNLLHVLNRELDADFAPDAFEHVAFYDRRNEWVEMRLRATRAVSVLIGALGLRVEFAAGEELRTEISAKFTRSHVEADLQAAGLQLDRWFTDADGLFGISLAGPRAADG